jgi:hypothetical protein
MLLMREWGNHLRAGNQLFQVAGMIGLCEKFKTTMALPNHPHYEFFENFNWKPDVDTGITMDFSLNNPKWEYNPSYWEEHNEKIKTLNCNLPLNMFFQSQLNWNHCENLVLERMSFKEDYLSLIKVKYSESLCKPTIAVSIRLNDFINHGNFYQIPWTWYLDALNDNFQVQDYNVIVFSDDIEHAKKIFKDYNFYYAEPNNTHVNEYNNKNYHSNPMEQLAYMSLCDNFIISQSTFSWWGAYMGLYKKSGKVVHSGKVFSETGPMKDCNTENYYLPTWIKHPVK